MAPKSRQPNDDRAKKTLYVTGFNPKLMQRHLLEELFFQGGPVVDVTLFETHAYILFQHAESVPYCLALFNDIELFGDRLRLKPRSHAAGNPYTYLDYLTEVRSKLREENSRIPPPSLPAKKYPDDLKNNKGTRRNRDKRRSSNADSDRFDRSKRRSYDNSSDRHDRSNVDRRAKQQHETPVKRDETKKKSPTKSTSNQRRQKRGGKRKGVGAKKVQKKYKYLV